MSVDSPSSDSSASWTLDPESLGRFLALLDPEVAAAARKYELLREKLIRLFEWRGCRDSAELADETINRVVRKVDRGLEIDSDVVARYSSGVAARVFQEYLRQQKRSVPPADALERAPFVPGRHQTTDIRLGCLEECLEALGDRDRELILDYYLEDRSARIQNRQRIAKELDITTNNLRIRAYRIRARLEACIERKLHPDTEGSVGEASR